MPRTVSARTKRYVRKSAEFQFNCTVRIFKNSTPVFDDSTGSYTPSEGTEIYNGPARIWSVDTGALVMIGEADLARRETYCSIPWDHDPVPRNDDTVEVLTAPDDHDLDGKSFRVTAIDGGGQILPTRRMRLSGLAENRSWQA